MEREKSGRVGDRILGKPLIQLLFKGYFLKNYFKELKKPFHITTFFIWSSLKHDHDLIFWKPSYWILLSTHFITGLSLNCTFSLLIPSNCTLLYVELPNPLHSVFFLTNIIVTYICCYS